MTDITEHKWSDEDVSFCSLEPSSLIINVMDTDDTTLQAELNKSDAIAIAKHFGLIHPEHKPLTRKERSQLASNNQ